MVASPLIVAASSGAPAQPQPRAGVENNETRRSGKPVVVQCNIAAPALAPTRFCP